MVRQKDQRISETQVERDKAARFSSTELDQFGIDDALKMRCCSGLIPTSPTNAARGLSFGANRSKPLLAPILAGAIRRSIGGESMTDP